jgi:hypothetical protein
VTDDPENRRSSFCRSGRSPLSEKVVGAPRFELGTPSPPDWCANRAALRSAGTSGLFRRASGPRTCNPACILQVFRPVSDPKSHRWGAGASRKGESRPSVCGRNSGQAPAQVSGRRSLGLAPEEESLKVALRRNAAIVHHPDQRVAREDVGLDKRANLWLLRSVGRR